MAGVAPGDSRQVAIALGSNLGDREATLLAALAALAPAISNLRPSAFIETDPVGVGHQPRFLNGAAVGETMLSARALLDTLLDVEQRLGRERPFPGAARNVDLDLILYDSAVIDEPGLQVPHPRFRDRAFVLDPLAAVAGDWTDPVTGLTIAQLRDRLRDVEQPQASR